MNDAPITKVYYNSACPVCRSGIASQQGKMKGCAIEWIDVHAENFRAGEVDADLETVREKLHVVTPDGTRHVGADAFSALWRDTQGQRWMSRLMSVAGLGIVARWAYDMFARRLYRWNRRKGRW